jgi:hypothetical protein
MIAYTHAGASHLDDFLGALTARLKGYEVRRVPKLPDTLGEDDIAFDIGGIWDDERYFDHHQDPSLPCSAALLWQRWSGAGDLYDTLANAPALDDLNDADTRVGIAGLPEDRRPDRVKLRALLEAEGELLKDPRMCLVVLQLFAAASDLRVWVDACYYDTELQHVLQPSLQRVLQAEREEQAVIDSIAVREVGDLRIGVSRQPLGRIVERAFAALGVDVLIAPNEREPDKLSVIRDSRRRYGEIPVAELLPALAQRATFVHQTGFMMVVALSIDEALGLV